MYTASSERYDTMVYNLSLIHILEELAKNRTTITIAHRLSTIRNADEILVVANNGIAERGNHDELLEQGGIYAHYYEMS